MCTACSGVTESALVARSENRCGLLRPVSQCRYRYLPRSRLRFPVFYTLKINVCGAITVLAKNVWFNANRRSCRRQFLTASFLGSAVQVKKKNARCKAKPTFHHMQLPCLNEVTLNILVSVVIADAREGETHRTTFMETFRWHPIAPYKAPIVFWYLLKVLFVHRRDYNKFCRMQTDRSKCDETKTPLEHL